MVNRYETFTTLIGSINRNIRRIKNETMKEHGLKSHHVSCLYYLYKEKALTSAELTEMCDEDKAAISRSIDYLEKNGFIKNGFRTRKRYKYDLSLTEKGIEIGKHICEMIDSVLEEASSGLTEENRMILYQSLALINDNLKTITISDKNNE